MSEMKFFKLLTIFKNHYLKPILKAILYGIYKKQEVILMATVVLELEGKIKWKYTAYIVRIIY
jgi:hypothetical protein